MYATAADITQLYGPDALYVADRDGDGQADTAAVDRALSSAGDEIDSYLGVRYALPLHEVPGILRQIAVDVAVYRLALSADVLSAEHRRRYEDAIAHLRRLASGAAALVFMTPPPQPTDPAAIGPQPIVSGGPERLFCRDKMRDL